MIIKWNAFNESLKRGSKIQAKIELLKDISLELTDIGLDITIHSGSQKDYTYGRFFDESKYIIMIIKDTHSVLDKDGYFKNELFHKQEILDFEESLKIFKMNYRAKKGNGNDSVIFYFDKQGSMTSGGNVLKNYL